MFVLKHILALACILTFVAYFFLSKSPGKAYLAFTLVFFPFMDLNLTPEEYGAVSVFDFISWFTLFFLLNRILVFEKTVLWLMLVLMSGLLFVGSLLSEFIQNSLIYFFKFFSVFILAKTLIDQCTEDPHYISTILKFLKMGAIVSLIFLVFQILFGVNFTLYSEIHPNINIDVTRYPSFFQDPQKYGQYLSMISFLFLLNDGKSNIPDKTSLFIFILVVLALLSAGSRAAFLGICTGMLVIILFMKSKLRFVNAILCISVYLVVINFSDSLSLFNRMEDNYESFNTRLNIWKENLEIFNDNPILGIGIGNHHNYILEHSSAGYYLLNDNERVFYGTESGYLQVLIEYGIFGFLIFMMFILIPLIRGLKSFFSTGNFNIMIIISSILSWMVAWSTVNSLSDRRILIVAGTLISLLVILPKNSKYLHA
ncbi:MAG TPA: O-antigen ligase family protein [Bacteroidales bacterium]|nr:O-antigen ligase family protein [Bacteroidales bacterium]